MPRSLDTDEIRLEPLGPQHNERDHAAWMSSIDHIHATPGWADETWPEPMTLAENLVDLERHARDFAERAGFSYSVLADDDVIGCVYIYPNDTDSYDALVQSWVRRSHAHLDAPLWAAVSAWLTTTWPFTSVEYAAR